MDFDTLAPELQRQQALTGASLDLTNDVLLVVDASQTGRRRKVAKLAPRALLDAMAQVLRIPLLACKNTDGSALGTSPAAGKFGLSVTVGTSEALTGETATSNTKTDSFMAEAVLPPNYVAGDAVSLVLNAQQVGVATVKTIDAEVYALSDAGAAGSDLCGTAAQAITTSAADYTFTVDPTGLAAGDRLQIKVTSVSTEAAAGNTNAKVNSARLTF